MHTSKLKLQQDFVITFGQPIYDNNLEGKCIAGLECNKLRQSGNSHRDVQQTWLVGFLVDAIFTTRQNSFQHFVNCYIHVILIQTTVEFWPIDKNHPSSTYDKITVTLTASSQHASVKIHTLQVVSKSYNKVS